MRTRPPEIDDSQIEDGVRASWGLAAESLEYVAVGGGSYHWRTAHLWLSLDDLDDKPFLGSSRPEVFEGLRQALEVATILRHDGLNFVVGPTRTLTGDVLVPVARRYALAVYPLLQGSSRRFGEPLVRPERRQLVDLLVRLHQARPEVATVARRVPIELADRDMLESALVALRQPWCGGPFAEPAREVVAAHTAQIKELLERFDGLAADLEHKNAPLVISHGEPHPANVLVAPDGELYLLDWDTVGLALPERDLWWLQPHLREYEQATGRHLDQQALRLYRLRWQMDDLIWCARKLYQPHTDNADTRLAWKALPRVVEVPAWLR